MGKFERKFGKYAVKNLSLILIICYIAGYVLLFASSGYITSFLTLNPALVLKGQVWRLFTWVLIPPETFGIFTVIMLFFYYSIGRSLERTWGDFLYNVYIFSGILFTILGSFILYGILVLITKDVNAVNALMPGVSIKISTYYINMSIFLAYAATFPEARVLLMFIFPIKMKWLGIADVVMLLVEFFMGDVVTKVIIASSLLNFVVFYLVNRRRRFGSPKAQFMHAKRRADFNREVKKETKTYSVSKHKCAICGRTEIDHPELEFRFCSKCNGNYEYCNEHLFTHKHVE